MKKLMTVLAIAGTFYAGTLKAQTDGGVADTASSSFIANASAGGMKEVQTGKLAESKGQSSSVKAFGAQMVTDHTQANAKLMKIAKTDHFNVPQPPTSATAPDPMLVSCSKSDFDKMYVTMMITDHKQTIALFQNAANNAVDTSIKSFAIQTLPILKQHLAKIQAIATQMGIAANQ